VGYNERGFFRCGIQRKSFFLLWDSTDKVFLRCGIQQKRIFSIVGYNGEQSQDGKQILFYCIPQCRKFFFRCILHLNRILCNVLYPRKIFSIVSHNAAGFLPLYPSMEEIFLCCGIQRKRFFFVVGYNGRNFPPLWDTTEEVFSIVVYNGRGFFPLWDTMEKNIQRRMIFLNFKCLSLPSNKNFGKISYLNSQTNPWNELKMKNHMANHEKKIFFHCGIQRSRDFF
jgi:hypothetical protein